MFTVTFLDENGPEPQVVEVVVKLKHLFTLAWLLNTNEIPFRIFRAGNEYSEADFGWGDLKFLKDRNSLYAT